MSSIGAQGSFWYCFSLDPPRQKTHQSTKLKLSRQNMGEPWADSSTSKGYSKGVTLGWQPVIGGAQQGFVLGMVLFNFFTNYLDADFLHRLFT